MCASYEIDFYAIKKMQDWGFNKMSSISAFGQLSDICWHHTHLLYHWYYFCRSIRILEKYHITNPLATVATVTTTAVKAG